MICSGCEREEAVYKATNEDGLTVFMCERCHNAAVEISKGLGVPIQEAPADVTISVCSQCGCRTREHHLGEDEQTIEMFICAGCGAEYELVE